MNFSEKSMLLDFQTLFPLVAKTQVDVCIIYFRYFSFLLPCETFQIKV